MNKGFKNRCLLDSGGFAIAGVVYSILLLFIILLTSLLVMLGNRKRILDSLNAEVADNINGEIGLQIHFQYKDVLVANQTKVSNFAFNLLDGVSVTYNGNNIDSSTITYTSSPAFNGSKNGTYEVSYSIQYQNVTASSKRKITVADPNLYTYDFKSASQDFIAPSDGLYEIELWGAQGHSTNSNTAGHGAYTKGEIDLKASEKLYVYVGEGLNKTLNSTTFNGGTANDGGWPGGGATDVRLVSGAWNNFNGLKSRIMVAAGSGSANGGKSGSGGTLTGKAGGGTQGGTQIAAASPSSSHYTLSSFGISNGGCAGGNGYYPSGGALCVSGSGGGSSFISGHAGCNAITSTSTSSSIVHTGKPTHYSGKVFKNTIMISGDDSMPNYTVTGTMVGNSGHGFAKITALVIPS